MRFLLAFGLGCCLAAATVHSGAQETARGALRPPAVPLIANDPYFSVWSDADHLNDATTRHWTGAKQSLTSLIRVDGTTYRLMGDEPKETPALPQTNLAVLPTRTVYTFANPAVRVTLTFTTPALPDDLEVLARPVTYLTWSVQSADGKAHETALYYANTGEMAVNVPSQKVVWSRERMGDLIALRVGTEDQPVLQKKGDDLRIDWGYQYAAAPSREASAALATASACVAAFAQNGSLPQSEETHEAHAASDGQVMAFAFGLGKVGTKPVVRHLTLAYDDIYALTYFHQKLRAYWRRKGGEAADLLQSAERDYPILQKRCQSFDTELMSDLTKAGGANYAHIAALAYRQCFAANKLAADSNGQPLLFPKENFSNGCIATVDVIYPMDPLFLLFSPTLAKASLANVLEYAASPRWKFPFAPHDLGTYPIANGQVYGGGERTETDQMPVEETGNILILCAAVAREEGNARFASAYWPTLTKWAEYLKAKGFDPENQLCTDDFAGHLAHNVNLSVKAIEALGAYGLLCRMRGETAPGADYLRLARELAAKWVEAARDGDHFKLAFDRDGTWSQKYNLVWDTILGLNLFAPDVHRTEIAFYNRHLNEYGLPLDSRENYTKLDWTIWTATLADTRAEFDALTRPITAFLDATPDRVPMTDWYGTKDARKVGFQARSVVGGVFIKMLANPSLWKKWAGRDKSVAANWATLPTPPQINEVVPTAQRAPITWRYTFDAPPANWFGPDFDDSAWKQGPAGFGTEGTPGAVVRTEWNTSDIWIRREFTMPDGNFPGLRFWVHHDEDVEIYLNGVLAATMPGYISDYDELPIRPEAKAALKPGTNLLTAHCHQTSGGQYIDVGLVNVLDGSR